MFINSQVAGSTYQTPAASPLSTAGWASLGHLTTAWPCSDRSEGCRGAGAEFRRLHQARHHPSEPDDGEGALEETLGIWGSGLSGAQAATVRKYFHTLTTGLGTTVYLNRPQDRRRPMKKSSSPHSQGAGNPARETGDRFTTRGNQHFDLNWPVCFECPLQTCCLPGPGEGTENSPCPLECTVCRKSEAARQINRSAILRLR